MPILRLQTTDHDAEYAYLHNTLTLSETETNKIFPPHSSKQYNW